jgi:tryptophan-rich sensory protein
MPDAPGTDSRDELTSRTLAMTSVFGLIISCAISFAAAGMGAMATSRAPEFYSSLSRPAWAPPSSAFGPVWTVLYALMAVAAWLVWREKGISGALLPLGLFIVQLVFNMLWSWIFFAWKRGPMAEIEIVVLLVLIALTLIQFWRVRPLAGALMLPYLLWVAYATALTFALVQRNPAVLSAG